MTQGQSQSVKPFFVIWSGQAVSLFGSALVQFALIWWLTDSTGSATVLAGATIVGMLPQIFLSPIAGTFVDRWNRRQVMLVADSVIALATLVLAGLFVLDMIEIWHVYLLMFVRSTAGAFHWPAMQASTTLMVPQRHYSRIAGMNQTLFGLSNIVSPPLGALLLAILPIQGILAIDVVTALFAIVPLFFIAIPQPEAAANGGAASRPSVMSEFREGLRFVWGWPGLLMVLVMATVINMLVNPAMSLLPLLVTEHFGGGASQLAGLQSIFGIGMVLGGVVLSVWGGFKRRIVTVMLGIILEGAGVAAIGFAPANAFALAAAAFFVFGLLNTIVNGSLQAVLQAAVPPEIQGRVFTLVSSGAAAAAPLGLVVAGPVADAAGVQFWFVIGGVAMSAFGIIAFFVPAIMHIEDRDRRRSTDRVLDQPGIVPSSLAQQDIQTGAFEAIAASEALD
jgi:DHA3 family macrolide efflux protein-like MFS transporter